MASLVLPLDLLRWEGVGRVAEGVGATVVDVAATDGRTVKGLSLPRDLLLDGRGVVTGAGTTMFFTFPGFPLRLLKALEDVTD